MRSRRGCNGQPLNDRRENRDDHPLFRKVRDPLKRALCRRTEMKSSGLVFLVGKVRGGRAVVMDRRKGEVRVNDCRVAMMSLLIMRMLPAVMYVKERSKQEGHPERAGGQGGEHAAAHRPIVDELAPRRQPAQMCRL